MGCLYAPRMLFAEAAEALHAVGPAGWADFLAGLVGNAHGRPSYWLALWITKILNEISGFWPSAHTEFRNEINGL
jgi:hypothetical protein